MIDLKRKEDCVGCNACVQRCPVQCINFNPDREGFRYPTVDLDRCIDCGLCEKVCPVINQDDPKRPLASYASKSQDADELDGSSSGGVFGLIAKKILEDGGVVFGAAFESDMSVAHRSVANIKDLTRIQRSKYSQSVIGTTYKEAESELKSGKRVLFSGTPCQIAGLRLFLRKDYSNLITVDVACHSVPSPLVWKTFIDSKKDIAFDEVNFRDKKNGWLGYGFSLSQDGIEVFYEKSSNNPFMKGFLKDLYTRPSCSECPAKEGRSGSDITLADFWGIDNVLPDFDFSKGASAVIVNTEKGESLFDDIITLTESKGVEYDDIISRNTALVKSAVFPKQRAEFWTRFPREGMNCIKPIVKTMQPSFGSRVISYIKKTLIK